MRFLQRRTLVPYGVMCFDVVSSPPYVDSSSFFCRLRLGHLASSCHAGFHLRGGRCYCRKQAEDIFGSEEQARLSLLRCILSRIHVTASHGNIAHAEVKSCHVNQN